MFSLQEAALESNLLIEESGFPLFSSRQCTQSLSLVPSGELMRTVNGELLFVGETTQQKYRSVIRGKDRCPPAFEGLWRGRAVRVHCIQPLVQVGEGKREMTLTRPAVSRSYAVFDAARTPLDYEEEQRVVRLNQSHNGPWYVQYRPLLDMMISDIYWESSERQGEQTWLISLEEI